MNGLRFVLITDHADKRQTDRKRRALSFSFTVHTDRAAVKLDELMNDRKRKAKTLY